MHVFLCTEFLLHFSQPEGRPCKLPPWGRWPRGEMLHDSCRQSSSASSLWLPSPPIHKPAACWGSRKAREKPQVSRGSALSSVFLVQELKQIHFNVCFLKARPSLNFQNLGTFPPPLSAEVKGAGSEGTLIINPFSIPSPCRIN